MYDSSHPHLLSACSALSVWKKLHQHEGKCLDWVPVGIYKTESRRLAIYWRYIHHLWIKPHFGRSIHRRTLNLHNAIQMWLKAWICQLPPRKCSHALQNYKVFWARISHPLVFLAPFTVLNSSSTLAVPLTVAVVFVLAEDLLTNDSRQDKTTSSTSPVDLQKWRCRVGQRQLMACFNCLSHGRQTTYMWFSNLRCHEWSNATSSW